MEEDFLTIRKVLDQRRLVVETNEVLGQKLSNGISAFTNTSLIGTLSIGLSNIILKTKMERSNKFFNFCFWSGIIGQGWLYMLLYGYNTNHYKYCLNIREKLDEVSSNNVKLFAAKMEPYKLSEPEKYLRKLYSKYQINLVKTEEDQRMWAKQQSNHRRTQ